MANSSYIEDHKYGRTDRFEIVSEWPNGYQVWNIGRANFPHPFYIPLCKLGYNPEPWMRNVDTNSLKAFKCESEEVALKCLKKASQNGCDYEDYLKIISE